MSTKFLGNGIELSKGCIRHPPPPPQKIFRNDCDPGRWIVSICSRSEHKSVHNTANTYNEFFTMGSNDYDAYYVLSMGFLNKPENHLDIPDDMPERSSAYIINTEYYQLPRPKHPKETIYFHQWGVFDCFYYARYMGAELEKAKLFILINERKGILPDLCLEIVLDHLLS